LDFTGKIFVSFLLVSLTFYLIYNFFRPLTIRAKGMSLSVARNWLWNSIIGYATPHFVNPNTTGLNVIKAANLGVKVFTPQIPFVRPFLLLHCNKYEPYLSLVTLAVCFDYFSSTAAAAPISFIIALLHSPVLLSPDHPPSLSSSSSSSTCHRILSFTGLIFYIPQSPPSPINNHLHSSPPPYQPPLNITT
jgi:hypothetical protein